ncbi:MAG: hypothetical protein LC808_18935 [Actinobacteria bacterium]|nr:hypothetical protein [Actinomycetota bacterium]
MNSITATAAPQTVDLVTPTVPRRPRLNMRPVMAMEYLEADQSQRLVVVVLVSYPRPIGPDAHPPPREVASVPLPLIEDPLDPAWHAERLDVLSEPAWCQGAGAGLVTAHR